MPEDPHSSPKTQKWDFELVLAYVTEALRRPGGPAPKAPADNALEGEDTRTDDQVLEVPAVPYLRELVDVLLCSTCQQGANWIMDLYDEFFFGWCGKPGARHRVARKTMQTLGTPRFAQYDADDPNQPIEAIRLAMFMVLRAELTLLATSQLARDVDLDSACQLFRDITGSLFDPDDASEEELGGGASPEPDAPGT